MSHDEACDVPETWFTCFSSTIGRPDDAHVRNNQYTHIYDVNRQLELLDRSAGVTEELQEWRDAHDISWYKQQCRKYIPSYSVGVFSSGGCCDTLAAIRARFTPVWGSEIDPTMNKMFTDLTAATCYDDTFTADWSSARNITYLKSGQTCTDYSLSGPYF